MEQVDNHFENKEYGQEMEGWLYNKWEHKVTNMNKLRWVSSNSINEQKKKCVCLNKDIIAPDSQS